LNKANYRELFVGKPMYKNASAYSADIPAE